MQAFLLLVQYLFATVVAISLQLPHLHHSECACGWARRLGGGGGGVGGWGFHVNVGEWSTHKQFAGKVPCFLPHCLCYCPSLIPGNYFKQIKQINNHYNYQVTLYSPLFTNGLDQVYWLILILILIYIYIYILLHCTRKTCSSLYYFCWHQHISCAWKFKYQIDKFCLWFSDCENDICNTYAWWTYILLEFCCSTPVSLSHSDKRRCNFAVHIHVASTLCAESASLVQEFWHIYMYMLLLGSPA